MKCNLSFHINFQTKPDEELAVGIFHPDNPQDVIERIYLQTRNNCEWHTRQETELGRETTYTYRYAIIRNGVITIEEKACPLHTVQIFSDLADYDLYDTWRWDVNQLNLFSSAFTKCVFKFRNHVEVKAQTGLSIKIHALLPSSGKYGIVIAGEGENLGNWDKKSGIELCRSEQYEYCATLPNPQAVSNRQYKYIVIEKQGSEEKIIWEDGDNRTFPDFGGSSNVRIDDGWVRIKQFTDWRGAGIVVPLFSLHTSGSAGVGDFNDLKRFLSWAAKMKFSAVQLLPINDTTTAGTWRDSYPYNITSAFALNPIYIDLRPLISKYAPALMVKYKETCHKLNAAKQVNYETSLAFKLNMLRRIYKEACEKVLSSKKFDAFINVNRKWLMPYAAYCCLRDRFKSTDFTKWNGFSTFQEDEIAGNKKLLQEMQYYYFTQYIAFSQMKAVHKYAESKGLILKGDIPIGVNICGADVWAAQWLFNRDMSTGAPPDYFSSDGQNWGFPTYNWDEMARDNYSWWRERLEVMSQFFDAYRIDHILGFFRIWEIPRPEKSAKGGHFSPALPYSPDEIRHSGFIFKPEHIGTLFLKDKSNDSLLHVKISAYDEPAYKVLTKEQKSVFDALYNDFFYKRHDAFWAKGATNKLRAVTGATAMLPCAEDLGMLPGNVGDVLGNLNILSLEIQSMPKQQGVEFANTSLYPYRSVATISTHDMPPLRLWWDKFPQAAARFAKNVLQMDAAPAHAGADICEKVVMLHLTSPSMLCLLSFQDWTSVCELTRRDDVVCEQINNPANPDQNWCYKTHLSIEQLERNVSFANKIRSLLSQSGRDLFTSSLAE